MLKSPWNIAGPASGFPPTRPPSCGRPGSLPPESPPINITLQQVRLRMTASEDAVKTRSLTISQVSFLIKGNLLMRNNRFLLERLIYLWKNHFADVVIENKIVIKFSTASRYRFGSIRYDRHANQSLLLINSKFKEESVPVEVVDHTIAHELSHYTHGFSSSARLRLRNYPHRGGVIDKELRQRRLGYLIPGFKTWVRGYLKTLALTTKK